MAQDSLFSLPYLAILLSCNKQTLAYCVCRCLGGLRTTSPTANMHLTCMLQVRVIPACIVQIHLRTSAIPSQRISTGFKHPLALV
jgi:hypothetical protein